jgi:hypothetical protein
VRAYLPLLGGAADPATLSAALADVRRAVAEIDQVVAGASPQGPALIDPGGVRRDAATVHLHLALFETRAHDFEGARREIERARQILNGAAPDTFPVAWAARQEGGPGEAPIIAYEFVSLAEFETLLGLFWSEARPIVFDFNTVDKRDLSRIEMAEAPGVPAREADRPLVERGAALLRQAIASGERSVSVPLPPGTYRLSGPPGSGLDRTFVVPESSDPDPVVVGADRFALRIAPDGRGRGPRFFLNGVEVSELDAMPYGYYRVKVGEEVLKDAPTLIRFIPGLGIDNKSKSRWTVFVPRGEMTVLRFGAAPPGGRPRN